MLYADKAALENRTKVKLLTIRERELTLYTNNCRTVGTVSALMAGIAYSALIYTKMAYFQESHLVQQFLYICGLVTCMCLSLRNVFGTTMLTMLGPGKALRGPDGSMPAAVDGMLDSFESIIKVQHISIYTFMATTVFYSWGAAPPLIVSSVMLTCLTIGLSWTMMMRTRVVNTSFPLLYIPLVSGAFFPKQTKTAADYADEVQAADRELREQTGTASRAPGGGSAGTRATEAAQGGVEANAGGAAATSTTTTAAADAAGQERIAMWQQQQQQQQAAPKGGGSSPKGKRGFFASLTSPRGGSTQPAQPSGAAQRLPPPPPGASKAGGAAELM